MPHLAHAYCFRKYTYTKQNGNIWQRIEAPPKLRLFVSIFPWRVVKCQWNLHFKYSCNQTLLIWERSPLESLISSGLLQSPHLTQSQRHDAFLTFTLVRSLVYLVSEVTCMMSFTIMWPACSRLFFPRHSTFVVKFCLFLPPLPIQFASQREEQPTCRVRLHMAWLILMMIIL